MSQLMGLARLLMGRTNGKDFRNTLYLLGNSYPLKGLGSRLEQRTCLIWFLPQGLYLTSHVTFKRYRTQNVALQGHGNGKKTWWVQDFKKHCLLKISTGR